MTTKTRRKKNVNGTKPVKARKIAILGYAEESRDLVYEVGDDYELWGINAAHMLINERMRARPTNWFQMHPSHWNGSGKGATGMWGRPKEHLEFLEKFEGSVWMQYPNEDIAKTIKNRKRYPLEQIAQKAGRDYLTSTFAYQFALIWYQHVYEGIPTEQVNIYGVNLSATEEYSHQRPCAEYWLGRLNEAGIKVYIPSASSLLKGRPYARGGEDNDDLSLHAFKRLQHYRNRFDTARADGLVAQAALGEMRHWANYMSAMFSALEKDETVEFPDPLKQKIQATLQDHFNSRMNSMKKLEQKGFADMNGAMAMVKDNSHWLTVTGGVDHTEPFKLPEYRSPSSMLWALDWEMPEVRAI